MVTSKPLRTWTASTCSRRRVHAMNAAQSAAPWARSMVFRSRSRTSSTPRIIPLSWARRSAFAAEMVPLALDSQPTGSPIRPAAFCGVFAIKPSHGLVSRAGVLQLSRKLDHIGAFARSLPDLALILDVIAGHDPADPDTEPFAASDFRAVQREPPPLPPRFAFVRTPVWDKAEDETKAAFKELVALLGSAVETVALPQSWPQAWPVQRTIMAGDLTHNLAPLVARGGTSKALRDLLAQGRKVSAVQYLGALAEARRYTAGL